jgi:Na+/H+ antiporter NhaD/arsenite permease-like protein
LANVDYSLLLMFISLFIINGAMSHGGHTKALFDQIAQLGVRLDTPWSLAAVTAVLSNLISNVPAVLVLSPAVNAAAEAGAGILPWQILALASTLAGNLTLVGSIANLIVAESAARHGVRLDLATYCAVGIPLTLLTVIGGVGWLVWVAG